MSRISRITLVPFFGLIRRPVQGRPDSCQDQVRYARRVKSLLTSFIEQAAASSLNVDWEVILDGGQSASRRTLRSYLCNSRSRNTSAANVDAYSVATDSRHVIGTVVAMGIRLGTPWTRTHYPTQATTSAPSSWATGTRPIFVPTADRW